MSIPPNVNGQKYKVTERFVQSGIHKYNSPDSKTYVCEFKQKERFVSSVDAKKNECLGIWHNSGNGWQLHISIDKNDNDTFILTPIKITSKNYVKELEGIDIEAGISKTNPSQILGVSYSKYKRIH